MANYRPFEYNLIEIKQGSNFAKLKLFLSKIQYFIISYSFQHRFGIVNYHFKENFMIFNISTNSLQWDGWTFGQNLIRPQSGLVKIR